MQVSNMYHVPPGYSEVAFANQQHAGGEMCITFPQVALKLYSMQAPGCVSYLNHCIGCSEAVAKAKQQHAGAEMCITSQHGALKLASCRHRNVYHVYCIGCSEVAPRPLSGTPRRFDGGNINQQHAGTIWCITLYRMLWSCATTAKTIDVLTTASITLQLFQLILHFFWNSKSYLIVTFYFLATT